MRCFIVPQPQKKENETTTKEDKKWDPGSEEG